MKKININSTKYSINGKEYDNINDIPEEFKKSLSDDDQNGLPDILADMLKNNSNASIQIDGKNYSSWEDVPEEYQGMMKEMKVQSIKHDKKVLARKIHIPWRSLALMLAVIVFYVVFYFFYLKA